MQLWLVSQSLVQCWQRSLDRLPVSEKLLPVHNVHVCVCMLLLQYRPFDGSPPMPVALKVIDCSEDDACSFERVYNEVHADTHSGTCYHPAQPASRSHAGT